MLTISEGQQSTLSEAAWESFRDELRLRLVERSPDLARTFDVARLNTVISRSVEAAESCGFTNRGPIRLYLDLCVTFGSGFVEDPVYQWAAEAIGNRNPETQTDRAEVLYSKALVAIDEICGPEDAYALAALRALAVWARHPLNVGGSPLEDYAVQQMRSLHPQKADHAGDEALRILFRDAEVACLERGVNAPRALILTTALKFAFGAGCLKDPLYGWIEATLSQKKVPDMAVRFERLERKALTWLDAVLSKQA